jgi:hypothetical protein
MKMLAALVSSVVLGAYLVAAQQPPQPPAAQQPMSFFVTSVGLGNGANLGAKTWHAYLSTSASGGQAAVNARDRIGSGPWYSAKGGRIAQNVGDLHGDTIEQARLGNNINKTTAISEKGEPIKGVGDTPNQHDMLTGSQPDGRAYTDGADHTCGNWTSGAAGTAQLGHHDRTGGGNTSWNSTHPSRGCSQENLVATGGAGLLYCFAIN